MSDVYFNSSAVLNILSLSITIELDGESKKLEDALKDVDNSLRNTQSNLNDVNKLLKFSPDSTELLAQKQKYLSQQIEDTEEKLKQEKEALKQLSKMDSTDKVVDQQERLQREVIATEQRLESLRSESKRADQGLDNLSSSARNTADAMDEAENSSLSFGDVVGGNFVAGALQSAIDGLKGVIEESKEYRKVMGSLEVSSKNAGYTAEETAKTYKELFGVLGDNQTAATTTSNLQALGLEQKELNKLVKGSIGAWAKYGDSIPIDSLAESITETARVGEVTGTLADVLNWTAGEEESFNKELATTQDVTERARKIIDKFTSYGLEEMGQAWQDNNKSLVEANKATADQQEALARLAEEAEPVLTMLMNLTTDIINFVVDNKEAVIAAIVAIGTTFTAVKIIENIQKASEALKNFIALIVANPWILLAAGIAAAATAVRLYTQDQETCRDSMNELASDADDAMKKMEDASKALEDVAGNAEDRLADVAASGEIARDAANDLKKLADKTDKTTEEQLKMAAAVDTLNSLYPDLGLEVDEVTGKLNKGIDEINAYIDSAERMAEIEAYKEILSDYTDTMIENQKAVIEGRTAYEDYSEEIGRLETQQAILQESLARSTDGLVTWNGEVWNGDAALLEIQTQLDTARQKQDELNASNAKSEEQLEASTEEYNKYKAQLDEAVSSTEAVKGATDEATGAAQGNVTAVNQELTAFQALNAEQQQLAAEITNSVVTMQNNLQSSIQQQLGLFDQLDTGAATSLDNILAGLQSQIDGVTLWEQNLATLIDRGINEDLLQRLIEAGPQTGSAVQAIVDAGQTGVDQINEKWSMKQDVENVTNEAGQALREKGAEYIGQAILELGNATEQDIAALQTVMSGNFQDAGTFSAQGLAEGITAAADQVNDATESVGEGVKETLTSVLRFGSPSKVTRQMGQWIDDGLRYGIIDNQAQVARQAQALAKLVTDTIKNNLPETNTKPAGIAAAQGVRLGLIEGQLSPVQQAASMDSLVIAAINNNISQSSTYSAGLNAAYGLAAGIRAGQSAAINAAANMAANALAAARRRLQIHSPSKAFEELGDLSVEGFAVGFDNDEAIRQIERSMSALLSQAAALTQSQTSYAPIESAIRSIPAGNTDIQIVVNAADGQSAEQIANMVMYKMQHAVNQKKAVWG